MKIEQLELRKYLLGELPEDSANELDARLFAEEDLHVALQHEQDALIEDFLGSSLSEEDEAAFRAQCARSPLLREKVDSFRILLAALEGRQARRNSEERFRRFWLRIALPSLACATALLLIVLGVHRFLISPAHPSAQLPPGTAQPTSPSTQPASPSEGMIATSAPPQIFFLAAGTTRGASQIPVLTVGPKTTAIDLQVELRGEPATVPNWRMELIHGTDRIQDTDRIQLSDRTQVQQIGQEKFLAAHVSIAALPNGRYSVHLTPLNSAGSEPQPGQQGLSRPFILKRVP
jgi:hypothetical protein